MAKKMMICDKVKDCGNIHCSHKKEHKENTICDFNGWCEGKCVPVTKIKLPKNFGVVKESAEVKSFGKKFESMKVEVKNGNI